MDERPIGNHEAQPLELWGGVECTRNRVQSSFFDQTLFSGHDRRLDDLDRLADLGVRTVRYPVLWESAAPHLQDSYDWSWADTRLGRLRTLGLTPIAGLVHHGSGPQGTDLLHDSFASGLADYAGALAARFPWLDAYTPVNEPLTTARFSALYGHWYPHARDALSFALALLNQCRAVVLAMEAIRRIRPEARLVQTEDLGTTYSFAELEYQAAFENDRRWLTFDLLSGRVDVHHPIGNYFLWLGIAPEELEWFQEHRCPPDIIGINHYVTSDRFLDHRLERHAACTYGGNGRDCYADVEAVRLMESGLCSVSDLLATVWNRYRRPVVATEAHLACSREDQVRWLWHIWQEAHRAHESGAEVRAVTAWSLFGAFDWDSLVTQPRGHYEPGAFDVRGPSPRKTAVGSLVQTLSRGVEPDLPYLEQPGWWQRPERLFHAQPARKHWPGRPILVTGGGGKLAQAFGRICACRALPCRLMTRSDLEITDREAVRRAFEEIRPWAVINAAGSARIDDAEEDPSRCFQENVLGAVLLAETSADARVPLVTFSSDLVFDGCRRAPYREPDDINPLNVYGRAKAEAERRIREIDADSLILRTSALFGPWDSSNFVSKVLQAMCTGSPVALAQGTISPTYLPDLVHATLDLLIDRATGLWHMTNAGEVTWLEMAQATAHRSGRQAAVLDSWTVRDDASKAIRPAYSALSSGRGIHLPSWQDALDRYFREIPVAA